MPWVAELTRSVLQGDGSSSLSPYSPEEFGPSFHGPERAEFRFSTQQTTASLVGLVQSRSKYLVADEVERRRMVEATEAVVGGLPQPFELPYLTYAFRAVRI